MSLPQHSIITKRVSVTTEIQEDRITQEYDYLAAWLIRELLLGTNKHAWF